MTFRKLCGVHRTLGVVLLAALFSTVACSEGGGRSASIEELCVDLCQAENAANGCGDVLTVNCTTSCDSLLGSVPDSCHDEALAGFQCQLDAADVCDDMTPCFDATELCIDSVDVCADVSTCSDEGATGCVGEDLVVCRADADGCLVKTTLTKCADTGDVCAPVGELAADCVAADDDECLLGTDDCSADAVCANTAGSFACACNAGFTGDGVTCTDDDECLLGTDDCSADAVCANTAGSFACACNAGFTGDGVTCTDDDECTLGTDGCPGSLACTNTVGSFTCECQAVGIATCDPVLQTGCGVGEKCASLVESLDPFVARTTCVPDGAALVGEACARCGVGSIGYDNCAAGTSCINGVCAEICSGPPDTCRTGLEAFDEGSYCTIFNGLFSDISNNIGTCVAACDPTDDTVSGGFATNADCATGEGCYLNATRGIATCTRVPFAAANTTQNDDCFGPASGGCFLNGCASGFGPHLRNAPVNASGAVCARYCTPVDTHLAAPTAAQGLNGDCTGPSLALIGGTNGNTVGEHQCRFLQSFEVAAAQVPLEIGMCVPVTPIVGGSWGDCRILDWVGIQNAWNGKVDATAANAAVDQFCLDIDANVLPHCLGYFHGCISNAEEAAQLDVYP